MKLKTILIALLSANTIIAAAFTELRHERRTPNAQSYNWAGAVLIGSGYNSVTATINLPNLAMPSGGSNEITYETDVWVGIDGDTCTTAILQTGITFGVVNDSTIYTAWCEWQPEPPYLFDGFVMNTDDAIVMTVTANSINGGIATLENVNTGQTVSNSFSGEPFNLCQMNAEWIVEDIVIGNSEAILVDFSSLSFNNMSVTTTSGETLGVQGATFIDMVQENSVLVTCGMVQDSEVTCNYLP